MVYGSARQRSEQITPAEDVAGVFCIPGGAVERHVCLYTCSDDDYSSAGLKTPGRREDKCLSARAGKRPRASGAERGRAHAPPLSLRRRSAVGFCLFRPVICLLLMMLLFLLLLLFFFFLMLSLLSVLLFSCLCLFRASPWRGGLS